MKKLLAPLFLALPLSCAQPFAEPTPAIRAIARAGTSESAVCSAQGWKKDRGWIVELSGAGFFIDPGELTDTAPGDKPSVVLEGPERYVLPAAAVGLFDGNLLRFEVPTSDSIPARALAPGVYDVLVTNSGGHTIRVPAGLTLVSAPVIESVELLDTGVPVPAAQPCANELHRFRFHGRNLSGTAAAPLLPGSDVQSFTVVSDQILEAETSFAEMNRGAEIYKAPEFLRAGCKATPPASSSFPYGQNDYPEPRVAAGAQAIWTIRYTGAEVPRLVSEGPDGHLRFTPLELVAHRPDDSADYRVPICAAGATPPACVPPLVAGANYRLQAPGCRAARLLVGPAAGPIRGPGPSAPDEAPGATSPGASAAHGGTR